LNLKLGCKEVCTAACLCFLPSAYVFLLIFVVGIGTGQCVVWSSAGACW